MGWYEGDAWVASPDVDPQLYVDKARRDKELKKHVSPEEMQAFEDRGGIARVASDGAAAVRAAKESGELPDIVVLNFDDSSRAF